MILDTIAKETVERVKKDRLITSFEEIKSRAELMQKEPFLFEKTLKKEGLHIICEVKKASPSKGIIVNDFPYVQIAKEYESATASCISVLTEPNYFLGSDVYLTEISQAVTIPILRKDFIIDEFQIYQAKVIGADCVLLIVSLLSLEQLKQYLFICDTIGLSAIVEAHDEEEVKTAIAAGARMLGINNRNLKNFEVDITNCLRLKNLIPDNVICIAESGIKNREDVIQFEKVGIRVLLIGETLMKSEDKRIKLRELKGIVDKN